jgi:hypothetical protein
LRPGFVATETAIGWSPSPGSEVRTRMVAHLTNCAAASRRFFVFGNRDPARVELVEVLDLPATVKRAISAATTQRRELEERSRAVQRDMEQTIRRLQTQLRLGVRDTGELLGISPQYAHKLRHAKSARRSAETRKAVAPRLPR